MGKNKKSIKNTNEVDMENLTWDDLHELSTDTAKSLIGQQHILVALAEQYNEVLVKDEKLSMSVNGLMKSYLDLANDIKEINDELGERKGKLDNKNDDEYYAYLRIGSGYITTQEKIASLSGTGFLDIFASLKAADLELNNLATAILEGKQELVNIVKAQSEDNNGK